MQELLLFVDDNMYLILCMFMASAITLAMAISTQNKRYAMLEKKFEHNTIVLAQMLLNQANYIEKLEKSVNQTLDTLKNIDTNPFDQGMYGYFEWGETIKPDEPTKDIRLQLVDNPPGEGDTED